MGFFSEGVLIFQFFCSKKLFVVKGFFQMVYYLHIGLFTGFLSKFFFKVFFAKFFLFFVICFSKSFFFEFFL